jgi:hypothetical protein
LVAEAEEVGGKECRPLTDAIDRLSRQEEIGEEDQQGSDRGEFGALVVLGKMLVKESLQLHSLEDSLDQRQGADVIGAEFEAVGLGVFSRECFPFGATW